MIKTVGFIGLGKLGMPCAEAMATKYEVNGYDVMDRTSESVNVASLKETVESADIIFVAVQTPHDPAYGGATPIAHLPNKDFDYTTVIETFKQIETWVLPHQLVVLISTVLPGTTRNQLIQHLPTPRFIYNPYLIAMGSVAWDMVNPEMIIIGTKDGNLTADANEVIEFYKALMENDPYYAVGTWDEAEAIKIFYNTFISMKVSMVNMIQDVAEINGNMNVDIVTDALKQSTLVKELLLQFQLSSDLPIVVLTSTKSEGTVILTETTESLEPPSFTTVKLKISVALGAVQFLPSVASPKTPLIFNRVSEEIT